jgi:uncharacterized SAM-binding protein YcdF (DUF218 family)
VDVRVEEVTRLLFLADDPEPADLAVVFGSADDDELTRRVSRGVELYREGVVPRLLLTGGGVHGRGTSEAVRMAALAQQAGVPPSALPVEGRSANTAQNATLSRRLLEGEGLLAGLQVGLLVSAAWHLRRAKLLVERAFPAGVRWLCCPAGGGCGPDDWWTSEPCRRVVMQEWRPLRHLPD